MRSREDADRCRGAIARLLFLAGVLGFCGCLLIWGAAGWAAAYVSFVAGWVAWLELAPESAVNRPGGRRDEPPRE